MGFRTGRARPAPPAEGRPCADTSGLRPLGPGKPGPYECTTDRADSHPAQCAWRASWTSQEGPCNLGPDATRIRVFAVPGLGRNRHAVTAEGAFGRLYVEIENVPSENPRTGKLSYLSTIAYLRDLAAPLRVGT